MADLDTLKLKRGALKGKLTRLKSYFEALDKNALNSNNISEVQARFDRFKPIWEEFEDIQVQIEQASAKMEPDEAERSKFENEYFKLFGDMSALLKKINDDSNGSLRGSNHSLLAQSNNSNIQSLVKLPPITLPTFDGQYSNWLEFKDTFVALVDNNNGLNDIQKFYYLRSSLNNDVLEIIKSIEVSELNYPVAWQFLKDRFENKKLIIYNHIRAIFEHPVLVKESYTELRNLYDSVTKHLRALNSLGENTSSWDSLIIYIMSNKFDNTTRRDWEMYKCQKDLPMLSDMNSFLNLKCEILEKLEATINSGENTKNLKLHGRKNKVDNTFTSVDKQNSNLKCYYCNNLHSIFKCTSFLNLSIKDRIAAVKKLKLCLNCLRDSHLSWKCQKRNCMKCNKAHNTILHLDFYNKENQTISNATEAEGAKNSDPKNGQVVLNTCNETGAVASSNRLALCAASAKISECSQVLLSTALIKIFNGNQSVVARALLDSGSQSNFISENISKKLNLKIIRVNHAVKGVGQTLTNLNSQADVTIGSHTNSNFKAKINCFIVPSIADRLPVTSFNKNILNIPPHLTLADPDFNQSREIDILLGSNIFWTIMGNEQVRLGANMPVLQSTSLGYVIAGNLDIKHYKTKPSVSCLNILDFDASLDNKIIKFWEIEEINNKSNPISDTDHYCERYFADTTTRDHAGRFVVRIPFNKNLNLLGDSADMALKRFSLLEKKLDKNSALKREYVSFMTEYEALGHMSVINNDDKEGYYLPHHAVLKDSSLTTKCRVVFDASAKTTSGLALNDVQYSGPTLQQDVFTILMRFRTWKYVLTGDISKMYRQILTNPKERKYQKIFWRANNNERIKVYNLETVTYGTASAPYLAVRCLVQIAKDNEVNYPLVSSRIKSDFYMDDLLTGSNSKEELLQIQQDIKQLLGNYGFELRKFLCNDTDLLKKFKINETLDVSILDIGAAEQNKTLGVFWDAKNDEIKYNCNIPDFSNKGLTKRIVLSVICQTFDPLGLLGPIVIVAKLIIQELWRLKVGWDEEIPSDLIKIWSNYYNGFVGLSGLRIPRCATVSPYVKIELHGFCDASIKAYGACIYIKCISLEEGCCVSLLCAKSRVAPLKQVSLPRLELCGALLLANLYTKVSENLTIQFNNSYFWSDSTITLAWIRSESSRWKTFVANRVSEIRSLTKFQDWHHVSSGENPADLLSRGTTVENLIKSRLWWHGPNWLSENESISFQEEPYIEISNVCEQKNISCSAITYSNIIIDILNRFSSFKKTLRVLAYIFRFLSNVKSTSKSRICGPLSPEELNNALRLLIKNVQIQSFPEDYTNLKNKRELNKRSRILSLNPFLQDGIIRVGGRMKNSQQSFENKHPIILPNNNFLTIQIIRQEHKRLFHCGVQHLLYSIREQYWPICGRNVCKKIVRTCMKCFRVAPKNNHYLMGDLPEFRVSPHCVFVNVGTDFGGPFSLKDRSTRGAKIIKGYMCLFVCMSTKAVHIELVSGLSTQCFLAAFKRFVSRRGLPKHIYSDNGTNYKGTNSELKKIYSFLTEHSHYIAEELAQNSIKWHFIPVASPSFGGIWEAGIKSVKSHIKRVIGETLLTFEEFATVLTQIEGILNSRPLCALSEDPDDISALTPGHFLIGKSLTSLPEEDVSSCPVNRLTRWKHLQALSQHYWRRWQKEYLSQLQTRVKWKQNGPDLVKVGTLVLIKNDSAPPMCWQLGRVTALHPGSDGITRVVELKVNDGTVRRAINRICALPIE